MDDSADDDTPMLGMDLPATLTFDYPTIRALSQYLVENLAPATHVRAHPCKPTLACEIEGLTLQ